MGLVVLTPFLQARAVLAVLAQAAGRGLWGWTFGEIVIGIIILAACVAVLYVALRAFGIGVPPWVVQIFWIVVVAFVAILAVRLLLSL